MHSSWPRPTTRGDVPVLSADRTQTVPLYMTVALHCRDFFHTPASLARASEIAKEVLGP